MSDRPSKVARDPRRLAVALAHLRRGLREGDDPLYDPWKPPVGRHRSPPVAPNPLRTGAAASDEVARSGARAAGEPNGHGPSLPRHFRAGVVFPGWALVLLTSALLFAVSGAVLRWRLLRPNSSGVSAVGRHGAVDASTKRSHRPAPMLRCVGDGGPE
jgi:hypothetical protein